MLAIALVDPGVAAFARRTRDLVSLIRCCFRFYSCFGHGLCCGEMGLVALGTRVGRLGTSGRGSRLRGSRGFGGSSGVEALWGAVRVMCARGDYGAQALR